MRALILHVNKFKTRLHSRSNKPDGILPEEKKSHSEEMKDGLVVFFCVEKGDSEKHVGQLYDEICKASDDVRTRNLTIAPFAHLSRNTAEPKTAKHIHDSLMKKVKKSSFIHTYSHFGYHKRLMLDVKGHPGSFRYREFN